MKGIAIAVATVLLVGMAGIASARSVEGARDIRAYEKAAQSSVPNMPATQLVDWQALDGQTLAVWTANDKPWLVRVDQPCDGLMNAKSVSMTSENSQITSGTDSVKFGGSSCKINSIQPVDYQKVAAMHHHRHSEHRMNKVASSSKPGT